MPPRADSFEKAFDKNLPPDLLEAFAPDGQGVVAFVGSGPSCDAGLPSWPELLRRVALRMGLKAEVAGHIETGRLVEAAQFLASRRSERAVQGQVARIIKGAVVGPGAVHKLIVQLPLAGIITTNYDLLLTAADSRHRFCLPATQKTSGIRSRIRERFVVHLHGQVDDPDTIIITRQGYDDVLLEGDAVRQFVATVFHSRVILFIGFGFADANVDSILRDLSHLEVLGDASVFALVPSPAKVDPVRHEILRLRSVNPIYILDRDDYGVSELKRWLRRLEKIIGRIASSRTHCVRKVCPPHVVEPLAQLLGSEEWIPLLRDAISQLPNRPDLAPTTEIGIGKRDVDALFDRLGMGEMRSILVFLCERRRHSVLEDALSCFPPKRDATST